MIRGWSSEYLNSITSTSRVHYCTLQRTPASAFVSNTTSNTMAAIVQAQCAARIAPVASSKASGRVSLKAGFSGKAVQAQSVSLASSRRAERLVVKAADAPAKAAPKEKEEEKPWTAPKLNPNTPSPIFGGSTGGLLRKAQVRAGAGAGEGGEDIVKS